MTFCLKSSWKCRLKGLQTAFLFLAAVFSNHSEGIRRINLFDCVWVSA
ncbi:hypothetical protein NEILACOT_05034 [Neisseria lactamica ATCC 23970]|uniref:Uncharacterized protein n=1 Tax=Neisseria lactamica ATCC 23970 TaxID=546265 RepID=D0WBV7_NEILA|nr:hypothetical protein NEILACOT_05034 [Neisseria lactamica ATCC 23970]